MIRQLSKRCWYVDQGRWGEEPDRHFPTVAETLSAEAEAARDGERDPRPVLATAGPCWLADCDWCERPLPDDDDTFAQVHHSSRRELTAGLDAAGWWVTAGGRLCCRGCAAARPAAGDVERVAVTVRADGTYWQEVGEVTACPRLAVTVRRTEPGGPRLGVTLTHCPTGHRLPLGAFTDDVGVLHRVAELLAGLDWSSSDPARYATGYTGPLVDAVSRAVDECLPGGEVS